MKHYKKIMAALSAVAVTLGIAGAAAAPHTEGRDVELAAEGHAARGSIALLPDTQFYSRYGKEGGNLYEQQYGPELPNPYDSQTQWIADNADDLNIGIAMHLGDVTDQSTPEEYAVAIRAMDVLENAGVPYSIIPGNHDVDGNGDWQFGGAWARYLNYFPVEKQAKSSTFVGANDAKGDGASNYHRFTLAGVEMMSINIADMTAFEWADEVLAANPTVPTIITSHTNLELDATNTAAPDSFGDQLWSKVVSKHKQVFLMYNGHNHGASNFVRYINDDPNLPVFQQVIDYQMAYQGGNGLMGLVELDFTNNQLSQTSFSPWVLQKKKEQLTSLDFALLETSGATYTIDFDFAKRFAQFGATFEPKAEAKSATNALRTHLKENFEAPDSFNYVEPRDGDDYVKVDGTLAHWRPQEADGKVVLKDISDNGNDMTLQQADQGEVKLVANDHFAYSAGMDSVQFSPKGKKEFAFFATADGAPVNAAEFPDGYTIETFLKMSPDTPDTWRSLLTRTGDYDGGEPPATITLSNLNEVQWAAGQVDAPTSSNWSGEIFKDRWYHIAITFDPDTGERQLYVDGNPMLRTPVGLVGTGLATMNLPWMIGGGNWEGNPDNAWYGAVGETRIVDHPTGPAEWLTARPAGAPSPDPTEKPTEEPTAQPTEEPTLRPTPTPDKPGKPGKPGLPSTGI